MAKKGTITSILMSNVSSIFAATYFRLGDVPLNNNGTPCLAEDGTPVFPSVASIKFCKHEFGAGALVQQPCYAVAFEGSPETMVIPATQFCQATITVANPDTVATTPAMPQG